MHLKSETAYRFAADIALATAFLIVWMPVAAGLIGIENDALVGAIALTYPNTASALAIVLLHGLFVALFVSSGAVVSVYGAGQFTVRASD